MPDRKEEAAFSELVILRGHGAKSPPKRMIEHPAKSGRPARDISTFEPGLLLERGQVLKQIPDLGLEATAHQKADRKAEAPLVLSPRRNFIEGRGYLTFLNSYGVFGSNDQAWFIPREGVPDEDRYVEVWLTDLTPGSSILVQFRVSGSAYGSFEIRGSDTTGVTRVNGGHQLTIPVLLHQVSASMTLIRISGMGMGEWGFYDATVQSI